MVKRTRIGVLSVACVVVSPTLMRRQQPTRARSTEESRIKPCAFKAPINMAYSMGKNNKTPCPIVMRRVPIHSLMMTMINAKRECASF
jgi:hypothetical protein